MRNVLDITIEDLDLGVRAFNVIRSISREINTTGDLIKYTQEDLMKSSGSTLKSLYEIEDALTNLGLTLKSKKVNMKLEIIKEEEFNKNPWYTLYVNNEYIMGSYTLSNVENVYDLCKNDPLNFKKETKTVLKSEEI